MFSLRIKLFLALLLASLLLIAGLLGLMQWSFTQGFDDYLQEQQRQRLDMMAAELADHYAEAGSWDELRRSGLRRHPRSAAPLQRGEFQQGLRGSTFVLDEHQTVLAGRFEPQEEHLLRPITLEGRVIGYIGERVRRGPQDFMERKFAEHQSRHFLLFGLLAVLVSLLVAFPLANRLASRIRRLLDHIRQLSQGNFSATLKEKGRDELSQLALHLNDLGQTLQHNAQAHRTLVADISHELRTPIAVLKAQLEAVEDGVQPLTEATVQRLQQQVKRLAALVDDLYQLSLADLGALNYNKTMLDLRTLVQQLAEDFCPRVRQAGLTLELHDAGKQTLPVLGDSQRLQQLFSNLLQNSIQYTNAPGTIRIRIARDNGHALIRVEDSAPGVPAELQPRLFERLFRAESSRNRNSGGAGLGLSLCQSITQAHGGTIDISDSALGGIAVSVRIPLTSA